MLKQPPRRSFFQGAGRWTLLLLVAGLLLTVLATWQVRQINVASVQTAADATVAEITSKVNGKLQQFSFGLHGARGAVLAAGVDGISRERFERYMRSRDLNEFPGARGFGFIRLVRRDTLEPFLRDARRDGKPDFTIRQLSPHDGDRYVIQYIEPAGKNSPAIGLDIASEYNRREAAERAMRSGEVALTGPITLVQATGQPLQSFLVLLPIYPDGATPQDEAARVSRIAGWSYAPLSMSELLGGVILDAAKVRLTVTDATDSLHPTVFYRSASGTTTKIAPVFTRVISEGKFGRTWQYSIAFLPTFVEDAAPLSEFFVAMVGVALSISVAIAGGAWLSNLAQRAQLARARGELSVIVENSIDAIIGKAMDGKVTAWNRGAQQLFGYSVSEALGRPLKELIIPESLWSEEAHILNSIAEGKSVQNFDTQRRRVDGSDVEVSVSVSPIHNQLGLIVGASTTIRDITDKKQLERDLLASHAQLEQKVTQRTLELSQAEAMLHTILDALPSLVSFWSSTLCAQFVNQTHMTWLPIDDEPGAGTTFFQLYGVDQFAALHREVDSVLRGESRRFEHAFKDRNGYQRFVEVNLLPNMIAGSAQADGFFTIMHDVTEIVSSRARLRTALHENQVLIHAVNSQLLVSSTDANGLITSVDERLCRLHGYKREELMGHSHQRLKSGEHTADFYKDLWQTIKVGKIWRGEICNKATSGDDLWFDTLIVPVKADDGNIAGYSAFRIDVTARRAAEQAVRQLNHYFGNVMRAATEISIIATDASGLITIFNAGAERMLGYDASKMVGRQTPARIHLPSEVAARGEELSAQLGEKIEGFRVFVQVPELVGSEMRDWTYVRKDGGQLTVSLVVTAMRDEHGAITGYLGIALDVTGQREQAKELAAAKDQLEMAASVARLGVWTWHIPTNSLAWNDQMFALYDYPLSLKEGALDYAKWRDRLHPDDLLMAEQRLQQAVSGSGEFSPSFRVILGDGSQRVIQAGAYVERDDAGVAIKVTGINFDITERTQFERSLITARHYAEEASQAKSQFLANMSHEIRTPLNAVLGMLQLLEQTELSTRQEDYVSKSHAAAQSLLGLLNDVLDYSKIEAGKLLLEQHPFSLDELMRDLGVVLSGNLARKDIELLYAFDSALPPLVIGDRLRLQQILLNLAGNAIKFTEQGQVVVEVGVVVTEGDQIRLHFDVTDTGIGIDEAHLQTIFEGFSQAEASTTRRFGGTGLGLSISRRLVELMGGELRVESEYGKGSSFSFEVNLAVSKEHEQVSSEVVGTLAPLNVLIVDDNVDAGAILSKLVQGLNWRTSVCSDGDEALEAFRFAGAAGTPFDVVLLDWRMPDVDGLTLANRIQAHSAGKAPMVIMVTAFGREVLNDAVATGVVPFDEVLTKPVTPKQLQDAVLRCLQGTRTSGTKRTMLKGKESLKGIHLLVVEDNAVNRQVASELLGSQGAQVTLAEGGLEGVRLAIEPGAAFDAILMDMQMPDIDGLEATRRIRVQLPAQSLPIIAMTANVSGADVAACLAAGMNAHVAKPIGLGQLVQVLLTYVRPGSIPVPGIVQDGGATSAGLEDITLLMARFNGDVGLYQRILSGFGDEFADHIQAMRQSIEAEDWSRAKAALHTFRGLALTVGAVEMAQVVQELEDQTKRPTTSTSQSMLAELALMEGKKDRVLFDLRRQADASDGQPVLQHTKFEPLNSEELALRMAALNVLLAKCDAGVLDLIDELVARDRVGNFVVLQQLQRTMDAMDFAGAAEIVKQYLMEPEPNDRVS